MGGERGGGGGGVEEKKIDGTLFFFFYPGRARLVFTYMFTCMFTYVPKTFGGRDSVDGQMRGDQDRVPLQQRYQI